MFFALCVPCGVSGHRPLSGMLDVSPVLDFSNRSRLSINTEYTHIVRFSILTCTVTTYCVID